MLPTLAVSLGRVLINAQIAAGCALTLRLRYGDVFLCLRLRLSKTLHSLLSLIRRIIQPRGRSARTHGQAAVRPTLSDSFYTPMLIRPDNEREGWGHVSQIGFDGAAALASAMLAIAAFFWRRRDGRGGGGEMIQFLAQMPPDTMIFFTVAVLSLAATLIALRLI